MILYRIRDWGTLFENSRSRRIESLDWVPVQNKHDGDGFLTIMAHPKAAEIYAAWHLILQVASKCAPRGVLVRENGKPHTPGSLAIKTRGKASWFELALPILCSDDVGWVIAEGEPDGIQVTPECHPSDTQVSPECQVDTTTLPGGYQVDTTGIPAGHHLDRPCIANEGNRREGNIYISTKKGATTSEASLPGLEPERPRFLKPDLERVKLAFAKAGMPEVEAEKFFNYYESNGWKVGRNPMRSLNHAVANWKIRWQTNATTRPNSRQGADRNQGTLNEGRADDYSRVG